MPARKQLWHDEVTKLKIKTSQIINRLQGHVFGENTMTPTQVRAAEILLRKTIPDLAQVEYTGEVTTRNVVVPEPLTEQQWNDKFRPVIH